MWTVESLEQVGGLLCRKLCLYKHYNWYNKQTFRLLTKRKWVELCTDGRIKGILFSSPSRWVQRDIYWYLVNYMQHLLANLTQIVDLLNFKYE